MEGLKGLSRHARAYILLVLAMGGGIAFWGASSLPEAAGQWHIFIVLAVLAASAQLFPVVTPKNQAYYVTLVFVFAGVLLLPPSMLTLLVILTFIPEWIKARYPWYIQLFNISNFLVDAVLARAVFLWLGGEAVELRPALEVLLAAGLAATLFTLLNHVLLAMVLHLARGHSLRSTGLFEQENLLTDATLCYTGIIAAMLYQANPWAISLTAAPLFLIFRALNTPNLQEQARTDDKTGLYNARRFQEVLKEELHRAARFERPLSVIMADLDLLRNINNTYGHLAGDVVLKGVANILKNGLRDFDLASRFGGEEFAIVLPEADPDQAAEVAERLRKRVEDARFVVTTSVEPIRVTVSLGVATYPADGGETDELLHQADLAVYYAKLRGRNRAWACSPESRALGPVMASKRTLGAWEARESPETTPVPGDQPGEAPGYGQGESGTDSGNGSRHTPVQQHLIVPAGASPGTPAAGADPAQPDEGPETVDSEPSGKRSDLTGPVALMVGGVVAAMLALWAVSLLWLSEVDWVGLGALGVLTVASQYMAIDIYDRGKISISAVLILAGGILWGMPGVLVLALVVGLATRVLRGGVFYRTLFDIGDTTLSGVAAVAVYGAFSYWLPDNRPVFLVGPATLAALAYYMVNVGLLSVVMSLGERTSPMSIWNERFRWLFLHYLAYGVLALAIAVSYQAIGLYGLLVFFVPAVMLRYVMKQYIDRTQQNVAELKRVNRKLLRAHDEVMATLQELRATYDATVTALSVALDSRDSDTEGHSRRVVEYAAAIAGQLDLPQMDMPDLLNGALLHDVGKIGVPDQILRKQGPLSRSEWDVMRTHPDQGYRMLAHVSFLGAALQVVRHHHEYYDGSGYPDGLRGEAIPLGARIFAVADALDAMTSDRPYRPGCSYEAAREEIARCAGKQFDPDIVEAFLRLDLRDLSWPNGRPHSGFPYPRL